MATRVSARSGPSGLTYLCYFLVVAVVGYFGGLIGWWALPLIAALGAYVVRTDGYRLVAVGFLAGLTAWGLPALLISWGNEGILAARMGAVFGGVGGAGVLIVTALLGGISGLLGAWVGVEMANWRAKY